MRGLIGRKVGMTQVYDAEGRRLPITVIEAGPCVVVQVRKQDTDGYTAAQVGFEDQKEHRLGKAALNHFKKAGVTPKRVLKEFPLDPGEELKLGDIVTAAIFKTDAYVDVTAMSKGQGFQGVVKRHRMAGGPQTHGGHSKRRIGAIGQRAKPGKIAKNKRMPGHMGHLQVTQQNLKLVDVRTDDNLLLVRGSIPGPNGGIVFINRAVKKPMKPAKA